MKSRIVLLGPPASGKGTQAEMINGKYGIETASPGAMLREQQRANTPLGIEAGKITARGNLLPDNLILDLVRSWFTDHDSAFVFDGFPRTCRQAEALEELLGERKTPLDVAFFLDATVDTISHRVAHRMVCEKCGTNVSIGLHVADANAMCPRCGGALHRRADDNEETLNRRMVEYREKSAPLTDWYSGRGTLRRVDANRTPDAVFADISSILEQ